MVQMPTSKDDNMDDDDAPKRYKSFSFPGGFEDSIKKAAKEAMEKMDEDDSKLFRKSPPPIKYDAADEADESPFSSGGVPEDGSSPFSSGGVVPGAGAPAELGAAASVIDFSIENSTLVEQEIKLFGMVLKPELPVGVVIAGSYELLTNELLYKEISISSIRLKASDEDQFSRSWTITKKSATGMEMAYVIRPLDHRSVTDFDITRVDVDYPMILSRLLEISFRLKPMTTLHIGLFIKAKSAPAMPPKLPSADPLKPKTPAPLSKPTPTSPAREFPTTGRKVVVKSFRANVGKAGSTLRSGMELDELDASAIGDWDSQKNTGVWIMGFGEPVKLMNTEEEEFEYVERTPETVLLTILSHVKKKDKFEDFEYMMKWIEKCGTEEGKKDGDLAWWASAIGHRLAIKNLSSPKAGQYIYDKLKEYHETI